MQVISGVSLPAYWLSNFIFDILKTYIPITFFIIIILIIQNDGFTNSIWLLLLFPLTIVPFTYMTSFWFKSDNTAQIFTIFMHFLFGAICPITLNYLQTVPGTF